jgi:hypothetical protein
MGMFDYVRSSYDFGHLSSDVIFQTKDLDEGQGGSLLTYWIDPAGVIWKPNYVGTSDFVIIEEDDPDYDPKLLFLNYKWVPTGNRGKLSPYKVTNYVEIYPSRTSKDSEYYRLKIHFKDGVIMDFTKINYD